MFYQLRKINTEKYVFNLNILMFDFLKKRQNNSEATVMPFKWLKDCIFVKLASATLLRLHTKEAVSFRFTN